MKVRLENQEYNTEIVSLIVEVDGELFEIEPDERIMLFNPNHDNLGRFARKASNVVIIAGVAGVIGGAVADTIVTSRIENKVKEAKSKGDTRKVSDIRKEILQSKLISKTINGKEISITYDQAIKGSEKVAKISSRAAIAGFYVNVGATLIGISSESKRYRQEYEQARQKAEEEWSRREQEGSGTRKEREAESNRQQWPQGATDDDFKNMYRKIAKRYHPDVNKSENATEIMQKINEAFEKKNWGTLEDITKQLQVLFESILLEDKIDTSPLEIWGMLLRAMKEALADGSEYITFPVREGDPQEEDFIYEDGEMIFDRITAQFLVDMFDQGSVKAEINFEELLRV